jgi:sortase A
MTITETVATGPRRRRHRGGPRTSGPAVSVVRGFGELLITFGLVLLLFCVYQLVYTNVPANRAMRQQTEDLQKQWLAAGPDLPPVVPGATRPAGKKTAFKPGQGFAIMYIPRLGEDYKKPVLEGVELKDLARGIGHYTKSALPGEVGNFAVAGHRATHGEPFADLPRLRDGDPVIVETRDSWHVYVAGRHKITLPTDVNVVAPVPDKPGVRPSAPLVTLTTCHPRWASSKRYIVFGKLKYSMKKTADGKLPAELKSV